MSKWLNLVFFISLIFFSCNPFDDCPEEPEPDMDIPFLVDSLLLNDGEFISMETPMIVDDILILFLYDFDTGDGQIKAFNKITFDELWTWQEALDEFGAPARGFEFISHYYDGMLCVKQQNISYGINVETGQTIWKNRESIGTGSLRGENDLITTVDFYLGDSLTVFKYARTNDGQWKEFYRFAKNDSLEVSAGLPYSFSWNNTEFIAFVTIKWKAGTSIRQNWLNLYNLTENRMQWISDTIPLNIPLSGTPGSLPVFEDGQILLANDAIYSYNVEDGSLEWWKAYNNSFVFSSHITTANSMVYGNNGDRFFIGLDVHSGEEKFRTTTGGSPSFIKYFNNKCYMADVSTSQSHVMVINATTGEKLFDVTPPFIEKDRNWVFEGVIAVDEETGYVYVSDYRYLLIYDFK